MRGEQRHRASKQARSLQNLRLDYPNTVRATSHSRPTYDPCMSNRSMARPSFLPHAAPAAAVHSTSLLPPARQEADKCCRSQLRAQAGRSPKHCSLHEELEAKLQQQLPRNPQPPLPLSLPPPPPLPQPTQAAAEGFRGQRALPGRHLALFERLKPLRGRASTPAKLTRRWPGRAEGCPAGAARCLRCLSFKCTIQKAMRRSQLAAAEAAWGTPRDVARGM